MMNRVTAILPAAGLGTRMGAETLKQFLELDGVPVLIFTLRRLAACPAITEFIISTRADEVDSVAASIASRKSRPPVRVVRGGDTRQDSVANALTEVPTMPIDSGARRGTAVGHARPDRARDRGGGRLRRGHSGHSGHGHGEGSEARELAGRRTMSRSSQRRYLASAWSWRRLRRCSALRCCSKHLLARARMACQLRTKRDWSSDWAATFMSWPGPSAT